MQPVKKLLATVTARLIFFPPAVIFVATGRFVCDSQGWDVTPNKAYTWGSQPPQGCSCQETRVPLASCKIFDCECVCDLTAGQCDVNCCCDAECTETELERFAELDACLDEGPADEVVTTCYSTDSLDTINPRYPLSGGGAAEGAIDGLLCVQYDNSDSKGEFYEDPGVLPMSIFSDNSGESEFSYHGLLTTSARSGSTEGDTFFDKGDRLPAAFVNDEGDTVAAFGGFLPLPVGDDTGRCNEANFVGFGNPIPSFEGNNNFCAREVETLEDECSSVFGWRRFSSDLYVGKSGTAVPGSTIAGLYFVQVKVSSTIWRDWDTGQEFDFSDVNCGAFYYNETNTTTTTTYSDCILGGGSGEMVVSSTNATVGCKNALASVCYTITHDGEGSVTAVSAAVVLTDVPLGPSGGIYSAASPQQFSVEFRLDETSDASTTITRSQDLGNLVERARSGNPGYLPGLPVLAGRLETLGDYEYVTAGGSDSGGFLELMAGEGRGCDDVGTSPVEFGYDGVGCCVLSLTRDALKESTSSTLTYVGGYGNADPLDATQWVEIIFSPSTDTASWDDASGICSSTVSTLEYQVLHTPIGSKANPQNKIVSANARYGKSDWAWREEAVNEQSFMVCNCVSFKIYDQESKTYIPPFPPVAFTVPWDVFYPFFIPTSGGTTTPPPSPYSVPYVSSVVIFGPPVLSSVVQVLFFSDGF